MSESLYRLTPQSRSFILEAVRLAPDGAFVMLRNEATRSPEQNDKMWAMLTEISEQLPWVDWAGRRIMMTPDEWKDFFTASLLNEQRMVLSEDGGSFVMVGGKTSIMGVKKMSNLIEAMYAFAVPRGVVFTEPGDDPARLSNLQG